MMKVKFLMEEKELRICMDIIKKELTYREIKVTEMKNEKIYFECIDASNQPHKIILNKLSGRYSEQVNDMILSYNHFAYTK